MRVLWERDGVGLGVDGDVLWLFVRDGNGMHSTSLTDETRHLLRSMLMGNARDFNANDALIEVLVRHGEMESR